MNAGDWIAAAVGATVLLGVIWRLLRAVHNGVNLIGHLRHDVADLHKTLNNGLRTDVQSATDQAKKAQQLAGDAARAASVAEEHASEGRAEQLRAINALRGEVDIYTNVVLSDRHRVRVALREAGIVLPDDGMDV